MKRKSVNQGGHLSLLEKLPTSQITQKLSNPLNSQISSKKAKDLPIPNEDFPYGQHRCGAEIDLPGLDGYHCSKCGWIGLFIFFGGRR